jgi:5-formyltetrahydrofolate cyclo-ligase
MSRFRIIQFAQINPFPGLRMKKTKALLRKQLLKQRLSLSAEEAERRSLIIFETLCNWNLFTQAASIMTYLSVDREVQTFSLALHILAQGKRLIVPKTDASQRLITPCELRSLEDLQPGAFNVPEPMPDKTQTVPPHDIHLHIVPGIVFDHSGGRIGYGLGFYDIFLKKANPNACRVALAFDFQLLPGIPQDVWDVPMDFIITEKKIIEGNRNPSSDI